jgi:replicative DNA helicase
MNNAIDIEHAVIGVLMIDTTSLSRCTVTPEMMFDQANKVILKAILELAEQNKPTDLLSVNEKTGGKLLNELVEITSKVASKANLEYHCSILIQKYISRELMMLCQRSISEINNTDNDVFQTIQKINLEIETFSIKNAKDFKEFKTVAHEMIKKIETMQLSGNKIVGLDTGFARLNAISNGWHSPDLVIISARPATGKTAFALNLAVNLAKQNIPVAFFSLEMSTEQLAMRVISSMTGIYSNYLSKAEIHEGNWKTLLSTNFNLPLYVDDTASLNLLDFKEKVRKAKKKWGIKAVFVDYLQLMTVYGKGNREQEISTISRTLKAMAKELDIPIIALAQLSRDVEKRNGEPRLSDLRESGAIEQDADIVIALHNEEPESDNPLIKVLYLKHRNGETGFIRLQFEKGKQTFKDTL